MHYTIIPAYCLDLIIGDPRNYPHPVKIIGKSTQHLETWCRQFISNQLTAGILLTTIIVGGTYAVVWAIIMGLNSINPWLGSISSIILIYTSISVRDLYQSSKPIFSYLQSNDLVNARSSLSMIVGRDTHHLSEADIVRATVETIAESTVDGIISPLFYAFIGGAPLALAYKAINTLDSMIGHNDDTYHRFGKFAARLDDVANFIPARIGGLIIVLASLPCRLNGINALKILIRDGQNHLSPNSGLPEAAFSGALGLQLGGDSFYAGEKISKQLIGDAIKAPEMNDIKKCHALMFTTSTIALMILICVGEYLKS